MNNGLSATSHVDQPEAYRAILAAPVIWNGTITGVLQALNRRPEDHFKSHNLEFLSLFANQSAIAIENSRLFSAAAEERRHIGLLYDVSREISGSLNPGEIFERAANLTCNALGGLNAEAYLYNPIEHRLKLMAMATASNKNLEQTRFHLDLRLDQGLAGWVTAHRQGVCVTNVMEDERWVQIPRPDQDGRSAISSPIQFGDQLLGVLTILHPQPAYFTIEHLSLLQAICHSVGAALSNANRYEESQRRLAEITLIQNLTQTFNKRLDIQELMDEAVCQLVQRLNFAGVSIYLVTDGRLELKAWCRKPGLTIEAATPEILDLVSEPVNRRLIRGNSTAEDSPGAFEQTYAELDVPILIGKSIVGVVSVSSGRLDRLTQSDTEVIQALAGQISVAMENTILYDQLRRQAHDLESTVARRTSELAELYALSQEIGFLYSYQDLLQVILRRLRNAMRCDLAAVCLKLDETAHFYIESGRKLDETVRAEIQQRCRMLGFTGANHVPVEANLNASQTDELTDLHPPISRLGSSMEATIFAGQKMVGALLTADEQANAFTEEQKGLLSTFAGQASSAVTRLSNILTEQLQQWENLVEHLPVGVLLLNPDFRVLVANPLGDEILQILNGAPARAEAQLTRLGEYSLAELTKRADPLAPIEITLETPLPRVINAQIRPVRATNSSTERLAAAGKPGLRHSWVLMLGDITQEKETQKRLHSQDRLATVGQLAAGIAHDFNNIMATIQVYSDLLRFDASISPASQEKLAVIRAQVQRASSLIRQILDFSRRSVIEHITLDLLPLLKEFDKMLIRVLPETIHLELAYQPGSYWVNGDPTRLQQVLMNLAVNARDAMPEGGKLRFELNLLSALPGKVRPATDKPAAGWVRIAVSDTGGGIPPEIMEHLFEPFYTTKPAGHGTGLGLAQVYGIVTQHGGMIDVQSTVGQGTRISVYLPGVQTQKKETGPLGLPAIFNGDGRTVLVVEDDAATREAIHTLLEAANCNVLAATNGIEALQKFKGARRSIDAVISDMVMPEMGGMSLYKAILEINPAIKILMITGHPLDEANQQMLERGDIRWLQKPFSITDFSKALSSLLAPG